MSSKSSRLPVILLVLAILGALYCLAGYLMVGSFASAAGEPQPYARAAVLWAVIGAACLVLAAAMVMKLRKRRHAH